MRKEEGRWWGVGVAVVVAKINMINVGNLMLRTNSHKPTDL